MRAQRAALDAETVRLAGSRACSRLMASPVYEEAEAVLAYWARDGEVPLDDLIADGLRRSKKIFLPRCGDRWYAEYRPGGVLVRGETGVLEPAGGARYESRGRAVVLVPLLAWTVAGDRLGRGGGWYDRVLPLLGAQAVGVGYEFQQRAQVPIEPWDVRLDFVVTESRTVACGGVLSVDRLS